MKKGIAVLVLISSLGLFAGLQTALDRLPRRTVPGASIIYIPSGQLLKSITLGYSSLAADLMYLWAVQYFSDTRIVDPYRNLYRIFSVIADLDPHYLDPYEIGAVIAVYEAKDPRLALRVLDLGIKNNPGEWLFPYQAGHYAQRFLKDYELARRYYEIAQDIPGTPAQTRRLFANALFETMDFQNSWTTWLEIYNTAQDERTRKIAENHLYQVKSAIDIQALEQALKSFRDRTGRPAVRLEELVAEGVLAALPQDLDGKDYLYDPETGEIRSATIPWKR